MSSDITNERLEYAILDQKVAGTFGNRRYAYIAVIGEDGWALGIAVANERGYNPIDGISFTTEDKAKEIARRMNDHIQLSPDTVTSIVISSMGGRSHYELPY